MSAKSVLMARERRPFTRNARWVASRYDKRFGPRARQGAPT